MKVVIDTNCLQTGELWAFLSLSRENLATLPDYVLMKTAAFILQDAPDRDRTGDR